MKTLWFSFQNHIAYDWGKERERRREGEKEGVRKGRESVWEGVGEGEGGGEKEGTMWIWLVVFGIRFNLNIFLKCKCWIHSSPEINVQRS